MSCEIPIVNLKTRFIFCIAIETCIRISDVLKFVNTGHQIDITRTYFRP